MKTINLRTTENTVIVHARTQDGVLIDVNISYDILDVIWDRDKGTLTLKVRDELRRNDRQ